MRFLSSFLILLISIYANASGDGLYGYYWSAGTNSLYGSTSQEAAIAECALYASNTPSCIGVSLQSSGETYAYYKRVLSDGNLSISQVFIGRFECDSLTASIPSCQEGYGEAEICEDGFPSDITGVNDYCDRRPLKQCNDGSYVRADTGICPQVCSDYSTCYNYALNDSSCASATYFSFNYIDPENWDFTCTQISEDSPDNANNGGNEDGNPYNDPNTPAAGEGSTPDSASIDPYSLAGLIGDELADDFSNVERAIRDDIDQSKTNTETIESAVNGVEAAVRDGIQSDENNTNSITNSVDALGSKLDSINSSLNSGPCDPNSPDYYQCIDTPMGNLPAHSSTGGASTIEEANANFKARIDSAEVVKAFSGMANLINLSNAQCPEFSMDLRGTPINELVSTTVHCDLMETIKPIMSSVMLIIYIWIAFRIFASA